MIELLDVAEGGSNAAEQAAKKLAMELLKKGKKKIKKLPTIDPSIPDIGDEEEGAAQQNKTGMITKMGRKILSNVYSQALGTGSVEGKQDIRDIVMAYRDLRYNIFVQLCVIQ